MDNRFGVKDFFLFSLMLVLIVLVVLAMKQYDRQYERVISLEKQSSQLTDDLARISRKLSEAPAPVAAAPTAGPAMPAPATPPSEFFKDIKAARAQPDFADGDWLVQNLNIRLGKITPLVSSDTYSSTVQARVLDCLIVRDPETLVWQPSVAESYEVHPDGLGVTYKLRKDVRFSDGVPLTSADVKFTFDRIMEPDLDAARSRSYLMDNGVTVTTPDDYTVVFRLKNQYYELLNITGNQGIIPKHFYEKYTPRQQNDNPGLLLGSGPFRLEDGDKWRPGTQLVLYRNERYWGVPPAFSRIVYLEVQEEAVVVTKLRNGEMDLTTVSPEQYVKLKKDEMITKDHSPFEYQSMLGGYTYVAWNQERGGKKTFFADKRVRQAMTMLIDRERMARELWYGYANVATGPFSTKGLQCDPTVKPLPFDVDRAKALLKEAGFEDRDNDGVLEDAQGNPFKVEFMYSSGNALGERIALYLKDQLAHGGIVLDLKGTDWPTMIERLKKSQFDMTSLGWTSSVESDLFQIFHSSQRGDAGDNRTNYSNPELDKLIEQARATVDTEKRMELWHACHRILAEDQPYTFLLERKSLVFYDKRIKNIKLTRMGNNFLATEPRVPPWYVPKAEQKYTQN